MDTGKAPVAQSLSRFMGGAALALSLLVLLAGGCQSAGRNVWLPAGPSGDAGAPLPDGGFGEQRTYTVTSNVSFSGQIIAGALVIRGSADGGVTGDGGFTGDSSVSGDGGGAGTQDGGVNPPPTFLGLSVSTAAGGPIPLEPETLSAVETVLVGALRPQSGDQIFFFRTTQPMSVNSGEVFTIAAVFSEEFTGTLDSAGGEESSMAAGSSGTVQSFADDPVAGSQPVPALPAWALAFLVVMPLVAGSARFRKQRTQRTT
jgi:hypothetical protein